MIYYNTNKITIKQKLQFENYGNGKILFEICRTTFD